MENYLIAAIVAEGGAIIFMFTFFLEQGKKCAAENSDLHDQIEQLRSDLGIKDGTLRVMERCAIQGCPFRVSMKTTQPLG